MLGGAVVVGKHHLHVGARVVKSPSMPSSTSVLALVVAAVDLQMARRNRSPHASDELDWVDVALGHLLPEHSEKPPEVRVLQLVATTV